MLKYCSILILFLIVSGCEDKPVNLDMGIAYFPLKVGQTWTYAVKKNTHSYLTDPVETTYELRISIEDSARINGLYHYFLLLETRNTTSDAWQTQNTWSAYINGNQAIQNESNVTRVKLTFPAGPSTIWNGNQYNNEPPFLTGYVVTAQQRQYRIENYNTPFDLTSGLSFENTLTVVISDLHDPIIGRDTQKEVYAHNIGLVYKEVSQLVFCNQGACTGRQQGITYTQTLTSYVP